MASGKEINHHFKKVVEGLPKEVMPLIGEGLQALADKRDGNDVGFVVPLNKALLKLSVGLLETNGSNLNPQQRLALCSGLFGDTIELKGKSGKRIVIEQIPTELYEQLLADIEAEAQGLESVLYPLNRMRILASEELKPLNLDRPGRYKGPVQSAEKQIDPQLLEKNWLAALDKLKKSNKQIAALKHDLLNVFSSTRIGGALAGIAEFEQLANTALTTFQTIEKTIEADPASLEELQKVGKTLAQFERFAEDTSKILEKLKLALKDQQVALKKFHNSSTSLKSADVEVENPQPVAVSLKPGDAKKVVADMKTVNEVVVQLLKTHAKKSPFLATSVLLEEQTGHTPDPGTNCYASPSNLMASIKKINAIHPNCFPQDRSGMPIMPPVVIVPGAGVVRWLDDRFLLSFVSGETQHKGPKLSFSPLDTAVMTLCGLFMTRGELFDYRGNRISGNFMADYSSQVESKAVAKFTGDAKKLTYTTSTQEKDAASRDDAVEDYIEFLYLVMNGLTIPKKISPRKVSVFLRYCIIKDIRFTAGLVLKYVPAFDPLVAREILTNLSGRDRFKIITLLRQVMEDDQIIGNKFRKDIEVAMREVMGRQFGIDAKADGLLEAGASEDTIASTPANAGAEQEEPAEHDFFDL